MTKQKYLREVSPSEDKERVNFQQKNCKYIDELKIIIKKLQFQAKFETLNGMMLKIY